MTNQIRKECKLNKESFMQKTAKTATESSDNTLCPIFACHTKN